MVKGVGGLYCSEHCGLTVLLYRIHSLVSALASVRVVNNSRFRNSSRSLLLKDSEYPFSQGLHGSMNEVLTPERLNHLASFLAMNSGPNR